MPSFSALAQLLIIETVQATLPEQNLGSTDHIRLRPERCSPGWHSGANQRGTLTILWSCLSTIIACTWTILHLNVPGPKDTSWAKLSRKAKWMLITIIFPEFIFSKAICELQMAVDDLCALKEKGAKVAWKVKISMLAQISFFLFHGPRKWRELKTLEVKETPEKRTSSVQLPLKFIKKKEAPQTISRPSTTQYDPNIDPDEERTWTLTHSYFANMGGLQRYPLQEDPTDHGAPVPLTAHALVNCCIGSEHDPLPSLSLQEADINDKSKADPFVKTIAVGQISWLILSVIVRAARGLPTSQIEICTTAFAVLAIATYAANWSKPKDVDTPIRFMFTAATYCEAHKYYAEPFFRRLLRPSKNLQIQQCSRIANDFVRWQSFFPPLTVAMAISTAIFGGLHCLAWKTGFPTSIEMMIWMVASVVSATLPTAALLMNAAVVQGIRRSVRTSAKSLKAKCREIQHKKRQSDKNRNGLSRENNEAFSRSTADDYNEYERLIVFHSYLWDLHQALKAFLSGPYPHLHCKALFSSFDDALKEWNRQNKPLPIYPVPLPSPPGVLRNRREYLRSLPQFLYRDLETVMHLLMNPEIIEQEETRLDRMEHTRDRISSFITIICGILYAIVRLMLLSLAFGALRDLSEGVYITTWTKNLPNIS